ncbi:DUF1564 domain-containing protein [Leptospira sp. 201903071]|uniref:DUF1564 domain-containing protein n=1 Tax=Leptospira ainazelensis TaxID=2810034 RepID=UPI00196253DF|nr:DUF1564 domain-containing protein [Leptospira ainazelensis]MBM9501071.1 DUF1564 domain-containing protein [Leptospira ainazelensis]
MGNILIAPMKKVEDRLAVDGKTNVETFLIPEEYWKRLNADEKVFLRKKIPVLMRRYGKYLLSLRRINPEVGKTMYQKNQGPLIRINVRMDFGTWAILSSYATAHGVSRCFLVNYMLWLEEIGVGESISETLNVGTPSFHDFYCNILTLDLGSNMITREFIFDPNPIYAKDRIQYS